MVKSLPVKRSQLSAVDRLIRLRFLVTRGPVSGGLEIIAHAEHSSEPLELLDAQDRTPLGRVTVFERKVTPLENTGHDEWIVRLQAEDEKAKDTLAALPPGPPDPY